MFADQEFGNSRIAPCSTHLKQRPCRQWLRQHADPADTVLYVGIDSSETRRVPAIERGWAPWPVRFPLCDPPRLYELGFAHNNSCGGVCVRAGQRHWLHLLRVFPDRYHQAEHDEQQLRAELGDVAILRERRGGTSRPLTLAELQRRQQAKAARDQATE